ncbi:MAG: AmmeMemoRadiSam system protein B [Candidatus Omnitrophota bacterium]|nr:AmmeMemoRadiSam system protein B [Candidatus Omnitrophota bacterium]
MLRTPVASGQFYPSSARALRELITSFIDKSSPPAGESSASLSSPPTGEPSTFTSSPLRGEDKGEGVKLKAIGIVVPHAGYVCSGVVAGAVYSRLSIPELVIILGPNHTGLGPAFSLMAEGAYQTPLGEVPISSLTKDLLEQSSLLEPDESAHQSEHSLEVQVPFLQFCAENVARGFSLANKFAIIPIVVGSLQQTNLLKLGQEIAGFIKNSNAETLIIASSDMTHYEPDQMAREKDKYALEAVLALDPEMLLSRTAERNISMCGVGPTAIMLSAARELNATKAELVMYNTSGDTCGDRDSVVGYAGVIIT